MRKFIINVNDNSYEVEVEEVNKLDGSQMTRKPRRAAKQESAPAAQTETKEVVEEVKEVKEVVASGDQEVVDSPMPGNIWKVQVAEGDSVKAGDVLFILEAMKMENDIVSPIDGTVVSLAVTEGTAVDTGETLAIVE